MSSARASGRSTRPRSSVGDGIWIGLVAGLSAFVIQMTAVYTATRRIASQGATISDFHEYGEPFHDITIWLVSDKLGGSIFALAFLPIACALLAAVGGALHAVILGPAASS